MLGDTLKKYRKACGLTQADVASALNIGRSAYTKYETNVYIPNAEQLRKLSELFGVTANQLLEIEPSTCTVASPNGNHNTVTTGDIHINQTAPLRSEHEKLLSVYDSLDETSKTQLMSVAYMLMSANLKARGIDVQQMVEQQLHKLQDEGGGEK